MAKGGGPGLDGEAEVGAMLGLLWRANHELDTLSKRMIKVLGVTGPQRMVLRIISRDPGISAGGISETARVHASTLTGILERLVRADLVSRARDAEDGRRARFELTAGGRRVAETRQGTVESAIVGSLSTFTPAEREVVRRWLAAFGDALVQEQGVLAGEEPPAGTPSISRSRG